MGSEVVRVNVGRGRRQLGVARALATAIVIVAAISGCSGGTSPVSASGPGGEGSHSVQSTTPARFDGVTVSGPVGSPPLFTIGDDTQATVSLLTYDVVTGVGPAVTKASKVSVHYVGRSATSKRQFDSSWDRGKPFDYVPSDVTFAAFSEGVLGMRAGGRRLVVVPGKLAFGATPPTSSDLGPDETLVFVIDLMSVL